MYGKWFGTFSRSYEGFYKKWEPNQNFEISANFDENFRIYHIGPYIKSSHFKYILIEKNWRLKFGMEALFNQTRSASYLASHQLVSHKYRGWL